MSWSKQDFIEGLKTIGLETSDAELRASLLVEALDWINPKKFSLHLEPIWLDHKHEPPIPLLEYSIGENEFDIDNADSPDDDRHTSVDGGGLNQFPLIWFVKVIEAAQKRLPYLWLKSDGIRSYLRDPTKHAAKLNEIWWLDRFAVTESVVADHSLVPNSDVDWRFRVPGMLGNDLWINLEVKYRVSDVVRAIRYDEGREPRILRDIIPKFRPSGANELNLAAITIFGAIDQGMVTYIEKWLEQNLVIDAVILFSYDGAKGPDFMGLVRNDSKKAEIIDSILVQPDSEDRSLIRRYRHVMSRSSLPSELSEMWPEK